MEFVAPKRKPNKPPPVRQKVTALVSLGAIFITLALALLNIDIIQIICNSKTQIRNGTEMYIGLQQEFPVLRLSTYLFNVTNAEEFLRGDDHQIKVEEVGPFTYVEIRTNQDMEVDEKLKVLRYSPKIKSVFLPEESVADPRDINVTMPNVVMLAMSSMISSHGYFAKVGYNLLINSLKSQAFVQQTAEEFLWGYDEPLIKLGNTLLPGWISFETIGIMDRMYHKDPEYRLEVSSDIVNKFEVKTLNGLGGLKSWDYEDPNKRSECNTFNNVYEGIMYPNMMSPETPIRVFRNDLCRFLELEYQGRVISEHGAEALRYKVGDGNFDINNSTQCLCGKGTCISGISDVSPCYYGFPLAVSNAHFLNSDPKLRERIQGLNPNEEEHGSEVHIEPKIGMVLKTSFSVQVNIVIGKVDFNSQAKRFSEMVVPLCYFRLRQTELNANSRANLRMMYFIAPSLLLAVEVTLFLAGSLMAAYSLQLLLPKFAFSRVTFFKSPAEEEKPQTNVIPLLEINRE